jgi:hypothetical protein
MTTMICVICQSHHKDVRSVLLNDDCDQHVLCRECIDAVEHPYTDGDLAIMASVHTALCRRNDYA